MAINLTPKPAIIIGGPNANSWTKILMQKLANRVKFMPENPSENFYFAYLHDVDKDHSYCPVVHWPKGPDGKLETVVSRDYGVVARFSNPFFPEFKVVVIAGVTGFGTWASMRLILGAKQKVRSTNLKKSFLAITTTEVNEHGILNFSFERICQLEDK